MPQPTNGDILDDSSLQRAWSCIRISQRPARSKQRAIPSLPSAFGGHDSLRFDYCCGYPKGGGPGSGGGTPPSALQHALAARDVWRALRGPRRQDAVAPGDALSPADRQKDAETGDLLHKACRDTAPLLPRPPPAARMRRGGRDQMSVHSNDFRPNCRPVWNLLIRHAWSPYVW